ncbi:MAG: PHP domain-containing protein [Clostridia bacterium]|nr:PHP domain-containing protein [Clostridia bacterium]
MEYTFAELHFHTKESSGCAEVSAYDAIPQYKENGYDLICVTDHFNRNHFWDHYYEGLTWEEAVDGWFAGWHAAKKAGEVHGITVLHGAEFKFDGVPNDYLVFGVTDEMYYEIPYMFTWTPEQFSEFARKNNIFFAQAHPFRPNQIQTEPTALIDGAEIFNSHPEVPYDYNDLAKAWAKENNLIPICGQDYHERHCMVGCKTRFHGEVADMNTLKLKLFTREFDIITPDGEIHPSK